MNAFRLLNKFKTKANAGIIGEMVVSYETLFEESLTV